MVCAVYDYMPSRSWIPRRVAGPLVTVFAPLLILWGCGNAEDGGEAPSLGMPNHPVGRYVHPTDSLPRLLFADGLVSLNDRCIVRHLKLNPKMPPVYVSGRPIGFC